MPIDKTLLSEKEKNALGIVKDHLDLVHSTNLSQFRLSRSQLRTLVDCSVMYFELISNHREALIDAQLEDYEKAVSTDYQEDLLT